MGAAPARHVVLQLLELAREVPVLFAEVNNVGACAAIQTPKQCIYLEGVEGFDYGVRNGPEEFLQRHGLLQNIRGLGFSFKS